MAALVRKSVLAMTGYTPGEQPAERGVVKLNTNENPYPPPPQVAEALRGLAAADLRLYPDPVARVLRAKVAALHRCDAGRVFVGNGSDEILALCTRAFVENDGSIGYFNPSYSLYPVLAAIRDVEARPVELGEEFEWRMPPGYRASLFFLANPNAPTGMLFERETVRDFCARFPGVVLIDEAYVDFARDNCAGLAMELDNVLVMRTFSKSFSLAGARVGYVLGREPLVEALFKLKDSYNTNVVSQRLALAALEGIEHAHANAEKIRATRGRLSEALRTRGFKVFPSEANFIWTAPPAGLPAEELYRRLRDERILIRYFASPRTAGHVRVTIGTDAEIDRLIAALDRLGGRV